jgi:hypothetical protein
MLVAGAVLLAAPLAIAQLPSAVHTAGVQGDGFSDSRSGNVDLQAFGSASNSESDPSNGNSVSW